MNGLESALAKTKRADRYLTEIEELIGGYLSKDKPYDIVEKLDRQETSKRYCLRVQTPPPVELGLAIGDCAHSLRCALDHLAWGLANPAVDRETMFPVCWRGLEFRRAIPRRLANVKRASIRRIDRFQPYHRRSRPELLLLWTIHELDRLDKHQIIALGFSLVGTITSMSLAIEGQDVFGGRYRPTMNVPLDKPFDDGDVLFSVPLRPNTRAQWHPNVAFEVAFSKRGPGAGRPVLPTLRDARDLIRDEVLPSFAEFFY